MEPALLASIVIPSCDRPDLLPQCLEALEIAIRATGRGDIEVIVTDDSSDDRSERLVAHDYPRVRWTRGPRRGPAANRNSGVAASQGRWIVFTDDDCIPEPRWLAAYLDAMRVNSPCCVFEGRTVADRERRRLDEEAPVNPEGGYLWSCNMAIARSAFDGAGGFCETFPYAAMEDADLRLRLRAQGQRLVFVPDAVVCHPYRATKGIRFAVNAGKSYLHLVQRHPHLLGTSPWRTLVANLYQRTSLLLRDAARCRFRGFRFGLSSLLVAGYFETLARLRHATDLPQHRREGL